MEIRGSKQATFHSRFIQDHGIFLVVSAIHGDCDNGIESVRQASSPSKNMGIHPRLTDRPLRGVQNKGDCIKPFIEIRVIPRRTLTALGTRKSNTSPGVMIRKRYDRGERRKHEDAVDL